MLYSVAVELTVVVDAEDLDQAEKIAIEGATNELDALGADVCDAITVHRIQSLADIPLDYLDCIPWGRYDDKTVRNILEEVNDE